VSAVLHVSRMFSKMILVTSVGSVGPVVSIGRNEVGSVFAVARLLVNCVIVVMAVSVGIVGLAEMPVGAISMIGAMSRGVRCRVVVVVRTTLCSGEVVGFGIFCKSTHQ